MPKFFSPYYDLRDFRNQLRAPMAKPIENLHHALSYALVSLANLSLAAVDLMTLNFTRSSNEGANAFKAAFTAIQYAVHMVVETVAELVALVTRSAASIVSAARAGVDAVVDLCTSPG